MKRAISFIIISVIMLTGLNSCFKKGENDPFVSLLTRKARLKGDWQLSNMESKVTTTNSTGTSVETAVFNGSTLTVTNANGTYKLDFTYQITFNKKGSYEEKIDIVDPSTGSFYRKTEKGNWTFLGKSKEGDLKNKEAIILSPTSIHEESPIDATNIIITGGFGSSGLFSTANNEQTKTLKLERLTKKEMVIKISKTIDQDGDEEEEQTTLTFEKKK